MESSLILQQNSLYCSEDCLRSDALNHHPLLGYDYAELKDFPRSSPTLSATSSTASTASLSPLLSPIPSFKEPPAFHLNQESPYQHIYQQKDQQKQQLKRSPIYLQKLY
jgi:hypothetical protein